MVYSHTCLLIVLVAVRRNTPTYFESIFIFGQMQNETFQPLGTCFAISNSCLLTAQHCMVDKRRVYYAIATAVSRKIEQGKEITDATGLVTVKVTHYDADMDYAIIEVQAKPFLTPIPISGREVVGGSNLKAFHCPIGMFNEGVVNDIGVFPLRLKSSSLRGGQHISCQGGMFSGSSGAPLVTEDGYAVGMHVESVNEAREVSIFEASTQEQINEQLSMSINSGANTHASIVRALRLGSCRELMKTLKETLEIPIHE